MCCLYSCVSSIYELVVFSLFSFFIFFFSSRRRHTRSKRDWSSDVCSSDLEKATTVIVPDYQLSFAIGKRGQNARLAAKLTGWKIDIKSESTAKEEGLIEERVLLDDDNDDDFLFD